MNIDLYVMLKGKKDEEKKHNVKLSHLILACVTIVVVLSFTCLASMTWADSCEFSDESGFLAPCDFTGTYTEVGSEELCSGFVNPNTEPNLPPAVLVLQLDENEMSEGITHMIYSGSLEQSYFIRASATDPIEGIVVDNEILFSAKYDVSLSLDWFSDRGKLSIGDVDFRGTLTPESFLCDTIGPPETIPGTVKLISTSSVAGSVLTDIGDGKAVGAKMFFSFFSISAVTDCAPIGCEDMFCNIGQCLLINGQFDLGAGGTSIMQDNTGRITGELRSAVPIVTTDGNDIQNATVELFRQDSAVREQNPDETIDEYLKFLDEQGRTLEKSKEVKPGDNGSFTFEDLPISDSESNEIFYTIQVTDASTEVVDPVDSSMTGTLNFAKNVLPNLNAEAEEPFTVHDILLTPLDVDFVDQDGEELDIATSFSHPYPVVELKQVNKSDLRINGNVASITIEGSVTDAIADIVDDPRAKITEVFVEFIGGIAPAVIPPEPIIASLANFDAALVAANVGPAEAENELLVSERVEVTPVEEQTSDLRPFAFKGTFSVEVQVPLWKSDILVTVRADNLIGNSGYDSFTIPVSDMDFVPIEIESETVVALGEISLEQISDVMNHDNTGRGLVNPIRVHITDPSVDNDNVTDFKARFFNHEFALKIDDDGQLQLDRPFMALARDFPEGIPNLTQAVNRQSPTTLIFREIERDFFWAYTAQSEPNKPKYAAGSTVIHDVRGDVFNNLPFENLTNVVVLRKIDNRWEQQPDDSPDIKILRREPLEKDPSKGLDPGVRIKMQLKRTAMTDPEKKLLFTWSSPFEKGPREFGASLGEFKVVRLKTVIVTVDGLAHATASELLTLSDDNGDSFIEDQKSVAPIFKEAFKDAVNRDSPALSALPTVTWTNWTGIFSGQPPRDHGITGNAFFEREQMAVEPFTSASDSNAGVIFSRDKNHGKDAVFGGLNERVKDSAGSLYDELARLGLGTAVSIHQWYYKSGDKIVVRKNHFPDFITDGSPFTILGRLWKTVTLFPEHSAEAAAALDQRSSQVAARLLDSALNPMKDEGGGEIDILTVYFPGPDNIAHAVGQERTLGTENEDFDPGPPLPIVDKPLTSIGQQIERVTDRELEKIVDVIKRNGYWNATLFALVADHGLHAFHNDDRMRFTVKVIPKVIEIRGFSEPPDTKLVPDGLAKLFDHLRMTVWMGEFSSRENSESIKDANVVYSPNGGMAQIYIRSDQKTWNMPPSKADIDKVAGLLFIEAMGGKAAGVDYSKRPCNCYEKLYTVLAPKLNPARPFNRARDNGALGNPPAIFVRVGDDDNVNHFTQKFRWVKSVDPTRFAKLLNGETVDPIEYQSIEEFLTARENTRNRRGTLEYPNFKRQWPEFEARIDEMNDKNPKGSRTGDILIFMDGRAGYLTVTIGDEFNGWHGGATISESNVPLMFSMPGSAVDKEFKIDLIEKAIQDVLEDKKRKAEQDDEEPMLRNWDLSKILVNIYGTLEAVE